MSSDLLQAVVAASHRAADERAKRVPRASLERDARIRPAGGAAFRAALAQDGVRIIAECKRRSPSKGVLRAEYDPVAIARGYESAGAAAISVLTEPTFFDGSLDHLRQVRDAVTTPLLRKDFIVTEYQVLEAAATGADAVLLIVAALEDRALHRLLALATDLGLAALVEVHEADELDRALSARADIIGVNSRNLRTLAVGPATHDELGAKIPRDLIAVAESGLRSPEDLQRLKALRYDAFLIGERFMTMADPGAALRSLMDATAGEHA